MSRNLLDGFLRQLTAQRRDMVHQHIVDLGTIVTTSARRRAPSRHRIHSGYLAGRRARRRAA